MTDEEKAKEWVRTNSGYSTKEFHGQKAIEAFLAGLKYNNKQIAELKEKISVLLSCKNCSENKGGWICVKEYENKCLAQKIEFIKELKEEKCELLGIIQGKDKVIQELKKELNSMLVSKNQQLVKAKELIEELSSSLSVVGECEEEECELLDRAEQFLRENE